MYAQCTVYDAISTTIYKASLPKWGLAKKNTPKPFQLATFTARGLLSNYHHSTPKWIGKTRAKQAISTEPTSQPYYSAASRDRSAKTTFHIPSPHMHNEIMCLHIVTVSLGACNQLTHTHKAHGGRLFQSALVCEEHALPPWTWVRRQQASRKKEKLTSNVLVLLSSLWTEARLHV